MKNLKVYDENDYEVVQIRYEEASWGRILDVDNVGGEIATNDTYSVKETRVDLSNAGFLLIDGKVVKKQD
jgi:hypothetical protein